MLSLRRYAVYIGLAACFLLTFTYFREPILLNTWTGAFGGPTKEVSPPVLDPSDPRFRWDQVPVRYPVRAFTPLPKGKPRRLPQVQHSFPTESQEHATVRKKRQAAVKQTFERCWEAYKQHAWMKDELAPLTAGSRDGFGGWAASLVDNLDTVRNDASIYEAMKGF